MSDVLFILDVFDGDMMRGMLLGEELGGSLLGGSFCSARHIGKESSIEPDRGNRWIDVNRGLGGMVDLEAHTARMGLVLENSQKAHFVWDRDNVYWQTMRYDAEEGEWNISRRGRINVNRALSETRRHVGRRTTEGSGVLRGGLICSRC